MQIKMIILYSTRGQTRTINLRLGSVNIISGRFYTGKSAVSQIVEYCLGNPEFEVPDGVIRQSVAWYGVLYQINQHEVFVAKPKPSGNRQKQSQAYLDSSSSPIQIPKLGQLSLNSSDTEIRSTISRLLREGMINNEQTEYQRQEILRTSLEYTMFYLFQRSNVIMNPDVLFHRQQEQGIQQTIRDTLQYFLGVVREADILQKREYERVSAELRSLRSRLRDAEEQLSDRNKTEISLFKQAQEVQLVPSEIDGNDRSVVISAFNNALQWKPLSAPSITNDLLPQLRQEINDLRRDFARVQEEIDATNLLIREAEGYSREVNESLMRLESIQIFDRPDDMFSELCPLCFNPLSQPSAQIESIRSTLQRLNDNLRYVRREQPNLQVTLQKLADERERLRSLISERSSSIRALVDDQEETREAIQQAVNTNSQISYILGRISYHLESSLPMNEIGDLRDRIEELQNRVNNLKQELDDEEREDEKERILNLLGRQMTTWSSQLELPYSGVYRLDLKRLTVIADTEDRAVPMKQMGGNPSILGCHLIALLALHRNFTERNRPVPNFIILDQPAQGFFPSEEAYKAIEGKMVGLDDSETDIVAVKRMFTFLFDVCKELYPNFQIIVLEHASLSDDLFKNALVEEPWTSDNALVPKEWIFENPHSEQLELF